MTFMRRFTSRAIATSVLAVGITAAAPAISNADQIDQALAAIPQGQISCDAASRYWTNEADYNSKVAQARALAAFDSRGPQILDALARVDEAANRCGLKGGGNGGGAPAPAPAPGGGNGGGAPAPAPAPAGPAPIMSSAPGLPSIVVPLPFGQSIMLPNLQQIVADFLGQFGIRF